ncbi:alpha-glucosidase/alpha-galactosidase [Planotetraspora thailandica]|uniref:Alpha-glucosidase/alpha-galactosidase n=1 Tax=Planotetraspora thailandica TaxID=487172 RepID=A0A8J3VAC7_9ACTN|nr:alpha-glucosidase/alpha-galactosidase [Planotetraspora thailandica]GII57119.1 alpha-glucosidase/alpha-galactosidase [Planotetraspora thailandica]
MKIVFVGAGSVVFTQGLLADLASFPELAGSEIALHDISTERLAVAEAGARRITGGGRTGLTVTAHLDRRAALDGADFVINMVQVGMLAATVTDFAIPASYGLRQTIGDTLGVGGIFRALRTFPFLDELAADITAVCPDAWLLNYTNPMAMNVTYLSRLLPRVVGLCHSVHWTMDGLAGLVGVPYDEVDYLCAGVNHQSWVLRFSHRGEDLYPRLDAAIEKDPELRRRVRVDMYRRLGYYPTESSEHSAEYVPWYLRHDGEVERLRLKAGEYVQISEENVASYERARAGDFDPVEASMEYAPQIIHAMVTGRPRVVYGNLPNHGLISNLPPGFAVEVPCLVDRLGVHPTAVGDLPPQCAALNNAFASVGDLTVRAAVEGRPDHIRHAAMLDPNTAATLTLDQIWALCDDMVRAHSDLLPESLREEMQP